MGGGDQPAFLASSTFFNISAASGAAGSGHVFFNKKEVARMKWRQRERDRSGKERSRGETNESLGAGRGKKRTEGAQNRLSAWLWPARRETGIPSILHIYSFSTIDTPRAGKGQAKGHKACRPGPKRTETTWCYGVQHFQGGFSRISFMAGGFSLVSTEMTSCGHKGHRRGEEEGEEDGCGGD